MGMHPGVGTEGPDRRHGAGHPALAESHNRRVREVPSFVEIIELDASDARFGRVLSLAAAILHQDRYLDREHPHASESHVLAAFDAEKCVGFLRYLVQVIGAEEGRPPVLRSGALLTEGYVEAFGVDPALRRHGIGSTLQATAIRRCRAAGCHQMRSRSPTTSTENYALKIETGYVLTPSEQNNSYYFLLKL